MIYLFDTSTWVTILRGRGTNSANRLRALRPKNIIICSIVKAELYFGACRSREPERNLTRVNDLLRPYRSLPFDDAAAEIHGKLRARLAAAGQQIGPHDLLISSIALLHGAIVVTHNLSEFSRVPELKVENWGG